MNAARLAALIRKEMREGLRAGWANIPATAAVTVMLLVSPLANPAGKLSPEAVALLQARLPIFLPLLAMPFYASTVLTRAIQTERLRGGLLPLLVYGGSAAEVWLAKLLGAFFLSYGVMLLSLAGYVGHGAWVGRNVLPPLASWPHVFITMPIASLSLIALQALLFWMMGRSALLSVILPIVVMFGGVELVVMLGFGSLSVLAGILAMAGSCAVVLILTWSVARFPRERAAGLVMR